MDIFLRFISLIINQSINVHQIPNFDLQNVPCAVTEQGAKRVTSTDEENCTQSVNLQVKQKMRVGLAGGGLV
jgi:hypothetical protein